MSTESLPQGTGPEVVSKPKRDLPFYNGIPTYISGPKWLVVVAACAVAYAQLVLLPLPGPALLVRGIHSVAFLAIPLLALAWAAPAGGWTAIFRRVRIRDFFMAIGFGVLNVIVTFAVAAPLAKALGAQQNPVGDILEDASLGERIGIYAATIPQLIGEELITILPMLALVAVLCRRGVPRNWALAIGWIVTAVMFGLLHLPAYNWNLLQCLLFIGVARVLLTLWYVLTKNLWVSSIAHITNDWIMFSIPILLGGSALLF